MALSLRVLGPADTDVLRAFLERHADSSMFLRANLREAGLADHGRPGEGTVAAALDDDGRVVGVAAHYWNGNVILQAPRAGGELARLAARACGRPLRGLLGPWPQVVAAREALGLGAAPVRHESREILYAVALDALRVPPALAAARVLCRAPGADDMDRLVDWQALYRVEQLGDEDGPALRSECRRDVGRLVVERRLFLLEDGGRAVSMSAFNAVLPDVVQIGGVFTPMELRGRGYARSVVAGSLLTAQGAGVGRAVLFTGEGNVAARRAYEALGFVPVGDYGMVFFA